MESAHAGDQDLKTVKSSVKPFARRNVLEDGVSVPSLVNAAICFVLEDVQDQLKEIVLHARISMMMEFAKKNALQCKDTTR